MSTNSSSIFVNDLSVEQMVNPIGIDEIRPRLSWRLAANRRNVRQTAYRILVATSEEQLAAQHGDVWDSGKVASPDSVNVIYGGAALASSTRYYWQVCVWDESDQLSPFSAAGFWEMGLLAAQDWKAKWIGAETKLGDPVEVDTSLPMLRREFTVEKSLARARAYVCGLGHFEMRLNGRDVTDRVLEPGWTDYNKTCLYVVYDITPQLSEGVNAVSVLLGNGFYRVIGGRYSKFKGSFGEPKLLMQIELTYEDGSMQTIISDEDWEVAAGPIVFSCIYGGEDYDATKEASGWDTYEPSSREVVLSRAMLIQPPKGNLKAQAFPPIRVMERLPAVIIQERESGVIVCDFGTNVSGWAKIWVQGPRGATVKLIPGELLQSDGTVSQQWTGSPTSFSYTLKGDGVEEWSPRFTYTGFRYMQVEGAQLTDSANSDLDLTLPTLHRIKAEMIYPDVKISGAFECSHPILNGIHAIINRAILSNMKSVMTDCPHREKLGWLEEVHLMGPSIMYNYNVGALYHKIIDDMGDAQLDSGLVPDIAPEFVVFEDGFRDSPEWGSAFILATWYTYKWYRDPSLLERHYEGMKRYIDYLQVRASSGLFTQGLGDWCDVGPKSREGYPQNTPIALTATAIFYYDVTCMKAIATLLGHEEDAQHFVRLAEDIQASFHDDFYNAGTYATGSQTSLAMPLAVGLVPAQLRESTLHQLVQDIRTRGNSMTGGDVGFRFLLMALTRNHKSEVIMEMLKRTEHPSYGYQIEHGATTLTELWNGPTEGLSQNHFMLGHAEEWLYAGLAGIRIHYDAPGNDLLEFRPSPVNGVEWAKAHHDLPEGRAAISWQKVGDQLHVDITVPPNLTALIALPAASREAISVAGRTEDLWTGISFLYEDEAGYQVYRVGSGSYAFTVQ
jgi:alpha-L-rhamnosidase